MAAKERGKRGKRKRIREKKRMRENEIKLFSHCNLFGFKCVKQDFIYELFLETKLEPINIFYEDGIFDLKNDLLILAKFSGVCFTVP